MKDSGVGKSLPQIYIQVALLAHILSHLNDQLAKDRPACTKLGFENQSSVRWVQFFGVIKEWNDLFVSLFFFLSLFYRDLHRWCIKRGNKIKNEIPAGSVLNSETKNGGKKQISSLVWALRWFWTWAAVSRVFIRTKERTKQTTVCLFEEVIAFLKILLKGIFSCGSSFGKL